MEETRARTVRLGRWLAALVAFLVLAPIAAKLVLQALHGTR